MTSLAGQLYGLIKLYFDISIELNALDIRHKVLFPHSHRLNKDSGGLYQIVGCLLEVLLFFEDSFYILDNFLLHPYYFLPQMIQNP